MMSDGNSAVIDTSRSKNSITRADITDGQGGLNSGLLVRPESLHAQAYEHIKAAIIAGEIESNHLYSVNQFAALLGVSRTPVREALLLLEQQGLLIMDRNRGFRVRPMTDSDIIEIIKLRHMLEIPAMKELAALQPAPTAVFADARAIYHDLQRAADGDNLLDFLAFDRHFHLTLIAALGNSRLTRLVGDLRDHMHLPGLRRITEMRQLRDQGPEHLVLLEAIEAGEVERAGVLMRIHLEHIQADWA
jgi:DNA-binding GntR family transcriptional regulator